MGRVILLSERFSSIKKENHEGFMAYVASSLLLMLFEVSSLVVLHLFSH